MNAEEIQRTRLRCDERSMSSEEPRSSRPPPFLLPFERESPRYEILIHREPSPLRFFSCGRASFNRRRTRACFLSSKCIYPDTAWLRVLVPVFQQCSRRFRSSICAEKSPRSPREYTALSPLQKNYSEFRNQDSLTQRCRHVPLFWDALYVSSWDRRGMTIDSSKGFVPRFVVFNVTCPFNPKSRVQGRHRPGVPSAYERPKGTHE